jgi:hypothetical protein
MEQGRFAAGCDSRQVDTEIPQSEQVAKRRFSRFRMREKNGSG